MNSRERLAATLGHRKPDRVPLDLGVGKSCHFHIGVYKRLLDHFGIGEEARVSVKTGQSAAPCDALLERLECDIRTPFPVFREGETPGEEWEDENGYYFRDEWGTLYRMPRENGHYYDMVAFPFAGLDEDDPVEFVFPEPPEPSLEGVEQARRYRDAGYPVIMNDHYGNGFLQNGPKLFGFDDWFAMLATEDARAIAHLDGLLEGKMRHWSRVFAAYGDTVDVVCESDDLGMQNGGFISPGMFRSLLKPYYKKLFDHVRGLTDAKIFLHSCGAVADFIPDLIDLGVEILNPVQLSAAGMDPAVLKREFGKDLVFWGGGIDTQKMLPYGTPAEIRDHVRRNVEIFARDGGYVFAAVHNIQADVPTENVMAMWEAFMECRYC